MLITKFFGGWHGCSTGCWRRSRSGGWVLLNIATSLKDGNFVPPHPWQSQEPSEFSSKILKASISSAEKSRSWRHGTWGLGLFLLGFNEDAMGYSWPTGKNVKTPWDISWDCLKIIQMPWVIIMFCVKNHQNYTADEIQVFFPNWEEKIHCVPYVAPQKNGKKHNYKHKKTIQARVKLPSVKEKILVEAF